MVDGIQSPAQATYWFLSGRTLFSILTVLGLACLAYVIARRLVPLLRAQRDTRLDQPLKRVGLVLQFWLAQWRHPRYITAGLIHILVFAGFLLLFVRALTLLIVGIVDGFVMPGLSGAAGHLYAVVTDYAATVVFVAMIVAAVRRLAFQPARYAQPARYGKWRAADAVFLLALIAVLMLADSLYEATGAAARAHQAHAAIQTASVGSLPWLLETMLRPASLPVISQTHLGAHFVHELTFFFLLCYRPFGIQFHVETSLFSIYFAKIDREALKPVRWGVPEAQLDQVQSFGVKTLEDFTWKHLLDFYSCADCGRCADQCPANAVGRPLSPRFLTIKARDFVYSRYPVFGRTRPAGPLVGTVYSEDEIWSCTTCGACEAECPLLVEYLDKIVDLRRGLVDEGKVPQSLQKPLKSLESRGNPFGKLEKKRADWTRSGGLQEACTVKVLNGQHDASTLYFVDSMTSYDDRVQAVARSTAKILDLLGERFGILGAAERDSGHDARRCGEELLFMALRDHNLQAIKASGVDRIVTADPHAYHAFRHDYTGLPPVEHVSEVLARQVRSGKIDFAPVQDRTRVYAYHDPCYLGRHNGVFDAPRDVLDAIPGLERVEMRRCRDRSFCCGGGGLALFYEPKEEERMGVRRVRMAAEAGANLMVTACPYCLVNIEDAIKVAGLEGQMTAMDLTEVVDRHLEPRMPAMVGHA